MTRLLRSALFIAEGSSDHPLADLVEVLFADRGVDLQTTRPDFSLLPHKVKKDLSSRLEAGRLLMGHETDLVIFHRDVDSTDVESREDEMREALRVNDSTCVLLPVVPVRMTEAWLLLDEDAIRTVAGNPRGTAALDLPTPLEVERLADPKSKLKQALLEAAAVSGRRRERLIRRFDSNRRQLLERLDPNGRVTALSGWQRLVSHVDRAASLLQ